MRVRATVLIVGLLTCGGVIASTIIWPLCAMASSIIEVAINPFTQAESRPTADGVYDQKIVNGIFDAQTGIGWIVNPIFDPVTEIPNPNSFALHQNTFHGTPPYVAPYQPNPYSSTVTYTFNTSTIVSGMTVVQHVNGITALRAWVGDDLSSLHFLGSFFGPSGDVTDVAVAPDGTFQNFDFHNTSISGKFLVVTVAKTVCPYCFAIWRMAPYGVNGQLILPANDTTPPAITCPANIEHTLLLGQTFVPVDYPAPTATDDSGSVTVTSVPASGSLFTHGVTTVIATATDPSGHIATCTFTVILLSPQDATGLLVAAVNQLVIDGRLNSGQANSLVSKLNAATTAMNASKAVTAANQMQSFINEVNALVRSRRLSTAAGQALIDAAQEIIAHLVL